MKEKGGEGCSTNVRISTEKEQGRARIFKNFQLSQKHSVNSVFGGDIRTGGEQPCLPAGRTESLNFIEGTDPPNSHGALTRSSVGIAARNLGGQGGRW